MRILLCFGLTATLTLALGLLTAAETPAAWRLEADRRIQLYRQGACQLQLHSPDGAAYSGPVEIRLRRHAFGFGTCVDGRLLAEHPNARRYQDFIRQNFNLLVSENFHKWYELEKHQGVWNFAPGLQQLDWAEAHGMPMRGHCLLWSKRKFVQHWAQNLSPTELRAELRDYLRLSLQLLTPRVLCWDGINEMLDGTFYQESLGPEAFLELYRLFQELAPQAQLFTNEYSIIDNDERCDRYLQLIGHLRLHGVRLAGIGIQEHAAERFEPAPEESEPGEDRSERERRGRLVPEEIWARLDRLAATGLPIHLTEISFRSFDEERKKRALDAFYRTAFAHPAVECILLWGFWERAHWLGRRAALVDADWNVLPAGEHLLHLLHEEWSTAVSTKSVDGIAGFTGFYGTYTLQAGELQAEFLHERRAPATPTPPLTVLLKPLPQSAASPAAPLSKDDNEG